MIKTRPCQPEDFDSIVRLLRQLWIGKPLNLETLRAVYLESIASNYQKYLCAVDGIHIIGFCSLLLKNNLWQEGYLAHIDEFIVDVDYRGLGIGSLLLIAAESLAQKHGCQRIELNSALHREEAHKFYLKSGFTNCAWFFSKALM